ncbi:hypothetical protein MVEN_00432500 [Mycena venus]|uniref:Uncharacterized protein n=1 Tax=Mycena venus TaxID=2733690 RepID=A0A8H7DBH1_9AGAR|nr:hypothetical protein MVEN_00432500 [Mycena venus]
MLLLLALVNISARSSPVLGNSLEERHEAASCDDIHCRTLFSIISGCLATIFACTWVSVHPNVPPPGLGNLALSWRRFCMMLVAVIAPELMAGFAARQFFDARWFSKEYEVSMTHGFFFAMGGFVSQSDHRPIVKQRQLRRRPEYITAIQMIRVEDIEDKSKGDSLSKGVVLFQGLWFTAQCLARIQQHLPVTELEVATLAFQFVNIFIWLLWWRKPLDARQPILLRPANELVASAERGHKRQWTPLQLTTLATNPVGIKPSAHSVACDPASATSVPSFGIQTGDNEFPSGVEGRQNSLRNNWQTSQRTATWNNLWLALISTIVHTIDGDYSDFDPESSISVPSFWSTKGPYNRTIGAMPPLFGLIECVMGIIFGAIHCIAWDETFPSVHEMLMWKSCSLVVAAVPLSLIILSTIHAAIERIDCNWVRFIVQEACGIVFTISIPAYIIARLVLIVLSFTTLRTLPPGAFVDVDWSRYIPHF